MEYPRELKLDDETETKLANYLEWEIINHEAERSRWIDDLKRWQVDYWAEPSTKQRKFPWVGAANIIIPLHAITLEAVHSRTMMTAFGLEQFVAIKDLPEPYNENSHDLEKFMDHECLKHIDMFKTADNAILELEKFGTGVIKTGWEMRKRTAVKQVGDSEEEFEVTVSQGPSAKAIPLAYFLMPFTNQDPQDSRWVGEEHIKTLEEVYYLEKDGLIKEGTYDKIKTYYTQVYQSGADSYRKTVEELQKQTPSYPKFIHWYELWMAFDVDGSNKLKEIVVHYHRQSRTFLSIRYNWYDDLHRPYRHGNYFPLENRWNGIGIGKQQEQFQREITIQHRQRLDSGTMANARMLKVKKLSGYGPGEPFFPGKIWLVDDMADVESFQLGDIPTSAFSNENATLMFSQQRSGINELNLGMPQAGTPGTATSDLARVQEGARKFDYTYRNVKRFLDSVVIDVAVNIAQFGPSNTRWYDVQENGQIVKQFFAQPVADIRTQLVATISTAGIQQNKLLDRQSWMQITQTLTSYYNQIMSSPIVQQNPVLMEQLFMAALTGGNEAIKQVLETYDMRNIPRILIDPKIVQAALSQPKPAAPPPGPGENSSEPKQLPGHPANKPAQIPSQAAGVPSAPVPPS